MDGTYMYIPLSPSVSVPSVPRPPHTVDLQSFMENPTTIGDVIALVQLGLDAVQQLNNARGAKARKVQSRLESLKSLLELCAAVISLSELDSTSTSIVHINHARIELAAALQLLPGYKRLATGTLASPVSTLRSIRSRVRDAFESLSWELRQSENVQVCLVKLSKSRLMIQLAIIIGANGSNANTQARTPRPTMNPLLRPGALTYNLTFAAADRVILTANQRDQPATNPLASRMVIIPDWGRSPIQSPGFAMSFIEVNSPVSVLNVLDTVHEWLSQPVEPDEWERSSRKEQRIAGTAFWERVRRAGPAFAQERVRLQGLRRIDYLGNRTYFGGLRPLPQQPDTWVLDLVSATAAR